MSVAESPLSSSPKFPSRERLLDAGRKASEGMRHGVSLLADRFSNAKKLIPCTSHSTKAIILISLGLTASVLAAPSFYRSDSAAEASKGSSIAEVLDTEIGRQHLAIYQTAIDNAFKGKLVLTRTRDLGPLDLKNFLALRQADTHNTPNPQWTNAFSFPGQEERSTDLTTTIYAESGTPNQPPIHDQSTVRRVTIRGDVSPIIGMPISGPAMINGLNLILGDSDSYQINMGTTGPTREGNTAAIAKKIVQGQIVSKASLDQRGEFSIDLSHQYKAGE